jgi:hypothetical protein
MKKTPRMRAMMISDERNDPKKILIHTTLKIETSEAIPDSWVVSEI